MSEFYIACVALGIVLLFQRQRSRKKCKLPLPPGPKRLPIIGNLLDMPSGFEWETYMKWSKEYDSDIIYLDVAGTPIVVLSSMEAATELLEKRSNIYSDRQLQEHTARLPMVNELMGWSFNFGFMTYGERWRKCRRIFHQDFNAEAVRKYYPKERAACHELLRRLLRDPDNIVHHLRHMAGEAIMSAAYGITVLPENDPYVKLAEEADSVPALMHIPEWFPGAGFKRKAKEWRKLSQALIDSPFAAAKRMIAAGTAPPSFTAKLLSEIQDSDDIAVQEEGERLIKEAAGTMYTGGTDTTVSALATFVLAMLSNPQAQDKAKAEIDSVIGNGRLPDFTDEESLPYVSAIVKEVLRWRSVAPLGVPHSLQEEDEYKGYRIPAQSIVMANIWAIYHDETTYPDPYEFKPERWLLDGKLNPAMRSPESTFGFGRRICVGRFFATSSIFITIASILATLEVTKAIDEAGKVIEPTHRYFSGMVIEPLPFKCSVKPRSKAAEKLIEEIIDEYEA
ncbi:cytochrome P450 [Mycena pura]|uniref:Cytochrome P450 n=1 Tax=Mycena pura TaxID=153505 RepID=A0AAD6V5G7_9AGAR|nr:cytochrome P450 [Mycena pura]